MEWDCRWDGRGLTLEVGVRGAGLTHAPQQAAGQSPYTDKAHGLGLGLFLAHAIIHRLDGRVTLLNREGGGVCTRVELPSAATPAAAAG